MRLLLVGGEDPLTRRLAEALTTTSGGEVLTERGEPQAIERHGTVDALIYLAIARGAAGLPAPDDAGAVLRRVAEQPAARPVVIASAAVHTPSYRHPGLVPEDVAGRLPDQPIARAWWRLERAALEALATRRRDLALLRPVTMPQPGSPDPVSRALTSGWVVTAAGFDPPLQLLSVEDLAGAVMAVLEQRVAGVFHVAPATAVHLRQALRLAGARRLPLPASFRRLWRRGAGETDALRHPCTVSSRGLARATGFVAAATSAQVAAAVGGERRRPVGRPPADDPFGQDRDYIDRLGRTLFRFLHQHYWRVEAAGLDHVPRQGRGVLVGVHRGFQPWDGVMALHLLATRVGRYPRFLIHPALVKLPFLAPYMQKLGGLPACRANGAWVLEREALLGVYPEGIRGAFTPYREAHRIGKAWRSDFVRLALRQRAPIVPFVTVGPAEVFPIWGRLDWGWWKRYSLWPYLPITTPVPLPSKWHTRFLEPLPLGEEYPPEAADDRAVVRRISIEVRRRLQAAIDEIHRRRPSIFYGKVFDSCAIHPEASSS